MSVLADAGAPLRRAVLDPLAAVLVKAGVGADAVSVVGTVGVVLASGLVACGQLAIGALLCGALALADTVDGTVARLAGRRSDWGAFLDSTLDRVADAAIVLAIAWYAHRSGDGTLLLLALGVLAATPLVPYVRARGGSLGADTPDGIASRADRLALVLLAVLAVGLGAPVLVLHVGLAVVALAVAATAVQRALAVRRQLTGRVAAPASRAGAAGVSAPAGPRPGS